MPHFIFQIMAIIIAAVGFVTSLPFQFFIPEKPNVSLRKLKWYKWFANPHLYLVRTCHDMQTSACVLYVCVRGKTVDHASSMGSYNHTPSMGFDDHSLFCSFVHTFKCVLCSSSIHTMAIICTCHEINP